MMSSEPCKGWTVTDCQKGGKRQREASEEGGIKAEMGKQLGMDPTNNHKWSGILGERDVDSADLKSRQPRGMDAIL